MTIAGMTLPSNVDDMTPEQKEAFMAATGQGETHKEGTNLPRLSINYDAEWIDENDDSADPINLPRGSYKISLRQDDDTYIVAYAKTAEIRPYHKTNIYSIYDLDTNSSILNTTHFRKWDEMVLDDLGNEFRANQYKKKIVGLYPNYEKTLKCQHVVFGTVTLPGAKDMHGTEVEVKDLPCVWYSKGASFMAVADAFKDMLDRGQPMQQRILTLTTTREKSGQVTYFPVTAKWGKENTGFDMELLVKFGTTIAEESKVVMEAFKSKKAKSSNDDLAKQVSGGDLSNDFDDELPDLMAAG